MQNVAREDEPNTRTAKAAARVRKVSRREEWIDGDPQREALSRERPRAPLPEPVEAPFAPGLRIDGRTIREAPSRIQPLPTPRVQKLRDDRSATVEEMEPLSAYSCAALQRLVDSSGGVIELRNLVVVDDQPNGLVVRPGSFTELRFQNCTFEKGLTLHGVRTDHLIISDVRAGLLPSDPGTLRLRRCIVRDRLLLTTRNDQRSVGAVHVRACQLAGGANMVLACSRVDFTGTVFGAPSSISVATQAMAGDMPELVSLNTAAVGSVRFEGFDLRRCRLRGAHGLDQARFARCRWARSPGLARRRYVYEELHWRRDWPTYPGWLKRLPRLRGDTKRDRTSMPGLPPRRWPSEGEISAKDDEAARTRRLTAAEVEELYRALARGALQEGDPAGAADFTWGQLTMRRLAGKERSPSPVSARPTGVADRTLVRAYRVMGGYGVRARWPIGCAVVVVLVLAALLALWGFGRKSTPCEIGACWESVASLSASVEPLARSIALAVGYLLTTARVPTQQVAVWVPGAIGVARFLVLAFVGLAAFAVRSRLRRAA
jgi:hypothetical protein